MIWKPIPSLPEYQASSQGLLRRCTTVKPMPKGGVRQYGGTVTAGAWSKQDRRYVLQYKGRTYRVARLICEAFHGTPPFEGARCLHLDENSRNNRPDNLKWGTQKENLNAPGFLEYCRQRTGENSPRVKGLRARAA